MHQDGPVYTSPPPDPSGLFGPGPNKQRGGNNAKNVSFLTIFNTISDPFWDPISGPSVLFSGVPCICGDLDRTENGAQNGAFGTSKRGQNGDSFGKKRSVSRVKTRSFG